MVDRGPGDPVLASHRASAAARSSLVKPQSSWLARAGKFPADGIPEISCRDSFVLQRDCVHPDGDCHVLSHVSTPGREGRQLRLCVAAKITQDTGCMRGRSGLLNGASTGMIGHLGGGVRAMVWLRRSSKLRAFACVLALLLPGCQRPATALVVTIEHEVSPLPARSGPGTIGLRA